MNFHIGNIYKKGERYRFIVSCPEGEKGYEADSKKALSQARGKMIKFLKDKNHKVFM